MTRCAGALPPHPTEDYSSPDPEAGLAVLHLLACGALCKREGFALNPKFYFLPKPHSRALPLTRCAGALPPHPTEDYSSPDPKAGLAALHLLSCGALCKREGFALNPKFYFSPKPHKAMGAGPSKALKAPKPRKIHPFPRKKKHMFDSLMHSFSAVVLILAMVVVGYIFGAFGWMKKEHKSLIINIIIKIGMPCMCINNILGQFSRDFLDDAAYLLLLPLLAMALTLGISLLIAGAFKLPRKKYGGFVVMCAFSNSFFIGMPMCRELFGEEAVPYVMCCYLINTTFFWTVGNILLQRSGSEEQKKPDIKVTLKKIFQPPLIAIICCIPLMLLGFKPPEIVITFTGYMADVVTPLGLIYIGFVLYEAGLKNLRLDRYMLTVCGMRFIVAPAIMLLLCRAVGFSGVGEGVFIIELAMPVMTQAVVVASSANADEQFVAKGMSLTTLACFIAIPMLMLVIDVLG